ncbi:carboxypeptidase regulatory-like domain-containing protein [Microbacterium album]|uniref:Alpha-amylase n=1 Tax=Microbacterium album TaxID=2053191 RepID=A0A917IG86_9MICO|nr:carboxypeptidase regulatory-like domain-containing protein [Microbacterium album]GGH46086.1 hypothetical protein GCM10010921_21930 [Microbacterium album]
MYLAALAHTRPSRPRARNIRTALVSLVAAALLLSSTSGAAFASTEAPPAPPAASISGTVTDDSGAPVAGAEVTVLAADGSQSAQALTVSDGGYTATGLVQGDYIVSVAAAGYEARFFPGVPTLAQSTAVTVDAGESLVQVDLTLSAVTAAATPSEAAVGPSDPASTADPVSSDDEAAHTASRAPHGAADTPVDPSSAAAAEPGAASTDVAVPTYGFSGRVTDRAGDPIADVRIILTGFYAGGHVESTSTQSGSDGRYEVDGLRPGNYSVSFSRSGYTNEAHHDVWIRDSGYTDFDVVLERQATLTGVALTPEGDPVPSVRVDLYTVDGRVATSSWFWGGAAFAVGVPAGSYFVVASNLAGGELADTYYPSSLNAASATLVTVAEGERLEGLDITLRKGYSISGTLTPVEAAMSGNLTVTATPTSGAGSRSATADADGSYTIVGLNEADYVLSASGRHDGISYHGYFGSVLYPGTHVSVTDADVTGIDIHLLGRGSISGTISAPAADSPVSQTLMTAYRWNGATWDETLSTTGWGNYSLGSGHTLSEGEYTVAFTDPGPPRGVHPSDWEYAYCPQYWNGKGTLDSADRFAVEPGRTTTGIDAELRLKSEGCADVGAITPGEPAISGHPEVGQPLTADPGTWEPAPVELAYQWLADGLPIAGETDSTFTPAPAHAGARIAVTVTGSRPGYTPVSATSPETAPVDEPSLTAGTPSISGDPIAGSVLTATPGTWSPLDAALSYQWAADGVPIGGANGTTFIPGESEVGKRLTVTVTGTMPGYRSAAATSAEFGPIVPAGLPDLSPGTPRITGDARVGSTLTAEPGEWGPQGVALTYQWLADGAAIAGATSATYEPTAADLGARLSVTVSGSLPGYTGASRTSSEVGPVAEGVIDAGTPRLSGDPRVGAELRVDPGVWSPGDVELRYAWYADDVLIEGSTGPAYVPGTADVGKVLRVEISGSKTGYATATRSVTSAAVQPTISVDHAAPSPGAQVTVKGEGFVPGETVRIELHSQPTLLVTTQAGPDGAFTARVTIPVATAPGAHTLVAIGESGRTASIPVTVGAVPGTDTPGTDTPGTTDPGPAARGPETPPRLAATGGALPLALAVAGILFLIAGASVIGTRTRSQRAR